MEHFVQKSAIVTAIQYLYFNRMQVVEFCGDGIELVKQSNPEDEQLFRVGRYALVQGIWIIKDHNNKLTLATNDEIKDHYSPFFISENTVKYKPLAYDTDPTPYHIITYQFVDESGLSVISNKLFKGTVAEWLIQQSLQVIKNPHDKQLHAVFVSAHKLTKAEFTALAGQVEVIHNLSTKLSH